MSGEVLFGSVLLAASCAAVLAVVAWLVKTLSWSGALAAFVIGTCVFGLGEWPAAAALAVFFVTSTALTKIGRDRKRAASAMCAKGGPRDAWQVVANGGVAAACMVLGALAGPDGSPGPRDWMVLLGGALAAANADTWATEVGGLWKGKPRLVTTWASVPAGVSGAVTGLGTAASLAGASLISLVLAAAWPARSPVLMWRPDVAEAMAIAWGGFMGSAADTFLGATMQAQYRCSRCGASTERREHCGRPTDLAKGVRWVDNDLVNIACTVVGAVSAYVLVRFAAQ